MTHHVLQDQPARPHWIQTRPRPAPVRSAIVSPLRGVLEEEQGVCVEEEQGVRWRRSRVCGGSRVGLPKELLPPSLGATPTARNATGRNLELS